MSLSSASKLYIVELVVYLLLLPFTLYLTWRHRRHGLLGYFYLQVYCLVRVVADIIDLLPANRDATHATIATAVLSAVGLSPLLLSLSGFLHEAHVYLVNATSDQQRERKIRRWLWFVQLQVHGVSILGVVLVIVGTIKLVDGPSDVTTDQGLRKGGAIILLILWAFLAHYAIFLVFLQRRAGYTGSNSPALKVLIGCILAAAPFIAVRCVYAALYVFDDTSAALNPVTGDLWIKVVFIVLSPLVAVGVLCAGGWISRGLYMTDTRSRRQMGSDDTATGFMARPIEQEPKSQALEVSERRRGSDSDR